MSARRTSQKLVSDEEKRSAIDGPIRRLGVRLGVNPDLVGRKISWGLNRGLPTESDHELAKAKGFQIALDALEEMWPEIRTREELDQFVQEIVALTEQAPSIMRNQMDQIRTQLARRGGPGREPLLNADQSKIVCDQIGEFIRKGSSVTEAIVKTKDICPEIIGKKPGVRTLGKAWKRRNEFLG